MEKNFLVTKIEKLVLFRKQKGAEKYTNTLPSNELIFDFSGEYTINFGETVLNVVPNTIRFLPCGTASKYKWDVEGAIPYRDLPRSGGRQAPALQAERENKAV